jgi:energy-coupling factor transporter ATP-binding protein EcfA2
LLKVNQKMSTWDAYPSDYRAEEVQAALQALRAGECVSFVGLSGSGKSNLLGYLAGRQSSADCRLALVDCNRLSAPTSEGLFHLARQALGEALLSTAQAETMGAGPALEAAITRQLEAAPLLCLLFDRFDALRAEPGSPLLGNLRALRDAHKYALTYLTATRRPMHPHSELAELFYANTFWLGSLSESDARWNVTRYASRRGLNWDQAAAECILALSRGYPSMLRAVCEAYATGAPLEADALSAHPAVQRRVEEFWADQPTHEELRLSGLSNHPLLHLGRSTPALDSSQLTAKEHLLWQYLLSHPGQVCDKDDLIRAVWPEDRIFERGVRDDSLAQLVRRLREKVEADPSAPKRIQTVAGRGYRVVD